MTTVVAITRIHNQEEASSTLSALAERNFHAIRHRAFGYFQQRGEALGRDWDDWLRAERELLWRPHAEMFENARAIVLRAAVPGLVPKSIQVTATPHSLVIEGAETHQHAGLEARLRFCEFGQRLFRRFDMPARIDPATVSATLDKGILEVVATIARPLKHPPDGG